MANSFAMPSVRNEGRNPNLFLIAASATLVACSSAVRKPVNTLEGKTFVVLGDSYSTFAGMVDPDTNFVWYDTAQVNRGGTDVCEASQMWWSILSDSLGMRMVQNNSFSGSTIGYHGYDDDKDGKPDDYSDRAFITRMPNLVKADYILIFGGTNDSWSGEPVGSYGQFSRDSLYTFRPAMERLLAGLKELQPEAKPVVIINSELRSEITASEQALADKYDVPYVVLYDIAKHWGHPTQAGQRAIAEQVIRALRRQ